MCKSCTCQLTLEQVRSLGLFGGITRDQKMYNTANKVIKCYEAGCFSLIAEAIKKCYLTFYGKIPDKNKGLLMRHSSCLLATTGAAADLPKAHGVGKKGMILKEKIIF